MGVPSTTVVSFRGFVVHNFIATLIDQTALALPQFAEQADALFQQGDCFLRFHDLPKHRAQA